MDVFVDWGSDPFEEDLTAWPVDKLDELGVLAYAGVEGVEVDEIGIGDEIPDHGVNAPREQVLPPSPEVT